MQKMRSVEINDRFVKSQYQETVWVVQKVVGLPELPKHYQLRSEHPKTRSLTMSESALLDRSLFRRAEDQAMMQEA